jgi:OOP family OmpA-OmpF porin
MLKKSLMVSTLAVAGLFIGASASAQNVYVGGTVGQSKWNDDCKQITKCDTNTTTYKLIGGYNFDKNFAFETSVFSLGKATASAPFGNAIASAELKSSGIDFAGVVKHDFTEEFGGFAKLGVARTTTTVKGTVSNLGTASVDSTSTQPVAALGLTYKVSKELALRGEFETRRIKFGSEKENVNTFSIGAQYSF